MLYLFLALHSHSPTRTHLQCLTLCALSIPHIWTPGDCEIPWPGLIFFLALECYLEVDMGRFFSLIKEKPFFFFFFFCFFACFWETPRNFWLCAQKLLLTGLGDCRGFQGLNLSQLCARQTPYMLCYHSGPKRNQFFTQTQSWFSTRPPILDLHYNIKGTRLCPLENSYSVKVQLPHEKVIEDERQSKSFQNIVMPRNSAHVEESMSL